MNYDKLLTDSYQFASDIAAGESRHEFLAMVFDITTYDSEMDELFVTKALEVCNAISDRKTFDYIKNKEDYKWYLMMVNLPFFQSKIEWGVSIRGAWWDDRHIVIDRICWAWIDDEQPDKLEFDKKSWPDFLAALNKFVDQP